jgi:hypothetical protein
MQTNAAANMNGEFQYQAYPLPPQQQQQVQIQIAQTPAQLPVPPHFDNVQQRVEYYLQNRWFWAVPFAKDETIDCCRCCPLYTGVLIFAIIGLVFSVIGCILMFAYFWPAALLYLVAIVFESMGIHGIRRYDYRLLNVFNIYCWICTFASLWVAFYYPSSALSAFFSAYYSWRVHTLYKIFKNASFEHVHQLQFGSGV